MPPRLTRDFFQRSTLDVAHDLLGKTLVYHDYRGRITETEAYIGHDDPACHAARGKTPRNAVMFEQAGLAYVYFIYGMYFCMNIVTEAEGFGAAVLIRGVLEPSNHHINGPGKLCRDWGITRSDNGRDLIIDPQFHVLDTPSFKHVIRGPRVGIKQGLELDWRFVANPKEQLA
jgi:DNA-3-methyladenine glycosylase